VKLVIITGQKGGVGKTLTAQVLATWLRRRNVNWRGADTDQENKFFADVNRQNVRAYTLYDRSGRLVTSAINALIDAIGEALEEDVDVFMVDMGAGQLQTLMGAMRETAVLEEVGKSLGLTVAYVLVDDVESLSTLHNNQAVLDGLPAQWVVVKNLRDGPLTLYETSEALRPEMQRRNALEMQLPALEDHDVLQAFKLTGLTLEAFADPSSKQPWSQRGRLKNWLNAATAHLESISEAWLPAPVPAKIRRG
jgi:nucleoside-triphosphatase THEP1